MGANSAGIYGAQLYRDDDEPRYRRAFTVCIVIISCGLILATIRKVDEILLRRRKRALVEEDTWEDGHPPPVAAIPQLNLVNADIKPVVVQET